MIDTTHITTPATPDLDTLARRAPATGNLLVLVDWLGNNGHTHLSAIERIELAERVLSRRRFLIGVGALVLAGCGPGEQAQAPAATTSASAGFPRTIEDFNGSVTVNAQPKRVVALNYIALQYLAPFLDQVELVGYAEREGMLPAIATAVEGLPSYNADELGTANLELLLNWKPDIAFASIASDYFAPVSQITTLVDLPPVRADSWRASTRLIGEALGLEARADAVLAETDNLIQSRAADNRGTLAIAYVYNPGLVSFQTDVAPLGVLLEELGYEIESAADPSSQGIEEISLELAADRLNVDHLLVLNYGEEAVEGIVAEPVLAALPVIAEKRYTVTTREFADAATFFSPATAAFVLDQLQELLSDLAS